MEINGKLRRQKIKCWVSSDDFILLMNKYLKECEVDFPEVYRGFLYDEDPLIRNFRWHHIMCYRMAITETYDNLYVPGSLSDLFSHIFHHVRGLDCKHMLSHTSDFYTALIKFGYFTEYSKNLYGQELNHPSFLVFLIKRQDGTVLYKYMALTQLEYWLRTAELDTIQFALNAKQSPIFYYGIWLDEWYRGKCHRMYYALCSDFSKAIDRKYSIKSEEIVTNIHPSEILGADSVERMKRDLFNIMKNSYSDYTRLAANTIKGYTGLELSRNIGITHFKECYGSAPWRKEFLSKIGYTDRFRDFYKDTYFDALDAGY